MLKSESKSFESALDAVSRSEREASNGSFRLPLSNVPPTWETDVPLEIGEDYLWNRASDWIPGEEIAEPAAPLQTPSPRAPPSVESHVIAQELGLDDLSTADELHRARRRFMWENHPDRAPDIPVLIANSRVATANMLVDRALQKLDRSVRKNQP